MILIFTNKEDAHPTSVIKYLASWGVSVFRLNTDCLLSDYIFNWWCDGEKCDFYIKNTKNQYELFGHEVTSIWDRRPVSPHKLPFRHKNRRINKYLRDEAIGFMNFVRYYFRNVYSIGSIVEDRPASSKMLQLAIAKELGASVPYTVIGNQKSYFYQLCKRYNYVSLKPINSDGVLLDGDKECLFYTRKVNSQAIIEMPEASFMQTACFAQNYIEKLYELRITVCCNDIIACKIDSQAQTDETGRIDWRQGYEHNLKHEIVTLPEHIQTFCKNFMKRMNLNFGCFDFIVTPEDEYVFLECNPNGQWLWIELATGYDISKIIAKNLAMYESTLPR